MTPGAPCGLVAGPIAAAALTDAPGMLYALDPEGLCALRRAGRPALAFAQFLPRDPEARRRIARQASRWARAYRQRLAAALPGEWQGLELASVCAVDLRLDAAHALFLAAQCADCHVRARPAAWALYLSAAGIAEHGAAPATALTRAVIERAAAAAGLPCAMHEVPLFPIARAHEWQGDFRQSRWRGHGAAALARRLASELAAVPHRAVLRTFGPPPGGTRATALYLGRAREFAWLRAALAPAGWEVVKIDPARSRAGVERGGLVLPVPPASPADAPTLRAVAEQWLAPAWPAALTEECRAGALDLTEPVNAAAHARLAREVPRALADWQRAAQACERRSVRALIAMQDQRGFDRVAVAAARARGLPTFVLQHGLFAADYLDRHPPVLADRLLLWGPRHRALVADGCRDEQAVAPGVPCHGPPPGTPARRVLRRRFRLPGAARVLCWPLTDVARGCQWPALFTDLHELASLVAAALCRIAAADWYVLLKVHPGELAPRAWFDALVPPAARRYVRWARSDEIEPLVHLADLALLSSSSASTAVLGCRRPTLTLVLPGRAHVCPWLDYEASAVWRVAEPFGPQAEHARSPDEQARRRPGVDAFLADYYRRAPDWAARVRALITTEGTRAAPGVS